MLNNPLTHPQHYDKLSIRQALSWRTIGFPTADIDYAAEKLLPPAGLYAGRCRVAEQDYPTLVNIGTNPTVGNRSTTVEGYMTWVAGDVYGQQLCFRLAMVACRRHSFHTAKITK